MAGMPTTFVRNRRRLDEIARVLTKYGFAAWVQRSSSLVKLPAMQPVLEHRASPEVLAMSDGERLRRALSELGTTWIKFGQMLSLRRELISDEVAEQLTLLQQVPADDPEVVLALVEQELGGPVSSFFRTFAPQPIASGSVAQVHRGNVARRHRGRREGAPRWRGTSGERGPRADACDRLAPGLRSRACPAAPVASGRRVRGHDDRRNRPVA